MRSFLTTLSAILVILPQIVCLGQGTLRINFDGPPYQPTGSIYGVTSYYESGMYFQPLPGSDAQFGRAWTGLGTAWPNDGTPFLITGAGDSFEFGLQNGSLFGLASVDLAGFSAFYPNYTVNFIGYHSDGSTITTSFSGNSSVDFQTYCFGPEWSSGLTHVEIPNNVWSLDNLVVAIPEPDIGALCALGAFTISYWQRRRKSNEPFH
jgi:hypothetical protein